MLRYLFYKGNVSKYKDTVSTRLVVQSKVENLQFYLAEVTWVTRLSGTFGYNQVFLAVFAIGMNKLH